jgi:hypothetical protein
LVSAVRERWDHDATAGESTASELGRLEARIDELERRLRTEAGEAEARVSAQFAERLDRLSARLDEAAPRVDAAAAAVQQMKDDASREMDALRMRVLRAERRVRQAAAGEPPTGGRAADQPPAGAGSGDAMRPRAGGRPTCRPRRAGPFDYFMFEQRFRGSVADIKQRQLGYLDLFRGRSNVVDLGCGRGEFVELLTEHGVR